MDLKKLIEDSCALSHGALFTASRLAICLERPDEEWATSDALEAIQHLNKVADELFPRLEEFAEAVDVE